MEFHRKLFDKDDQYVGTVRVTWTMNQMPGCCGMQVISHCSSNIVQEREGSVYETRGKYLERSNNAHKLLENEKLRISIYNQMLALILKQCAKNTGTILSTDYVSKWKNTRQFRLYDMGTLLGWEMNTPVVNPNTGNKIVHFSYYTGSKKRKE